MSIERLASVWPEWQVVAQIGEGSYGKVYQAVRNEHDMISNAAIKVISIPQNESEIDSLHNEGLDDIAVKSYFASIVSDFVKEIKLMESLKGITNVVNVDDYKVLEKEGSLGWDIFIRMELLVPFNEYLAKHTMKEDDVLKLGIDICNALELCAQKNIIHRDIKPENIFVSSFGDFKIGDFGIAREMDNVSGSLSAKGTFSYMAPEVAMGHNYNASVDIYSLGLVLYKLLNNNRLPFIDPYSNQISYGDRKRANERRFSGEMLPAPCNASDSLAKVVLFAAAHDPEKRFKSAAAFKKALQSVVGDRDLPVIAMDFKASVAAIAAKHPYTVQNKAVPVTNIQKQPKSATPVTPKDQFDPNRYKPSVSALSLKKRKEQEAKKKKTIITVSIISGAVVLIGIIIAIIIIIGGGGSNDNPKTTTASTAGNSGLVTPPTTTSASDTTKEPDTDPDEVITGKVENLINALSIGEYDAVKNTYNELVDNAEGLEAMKNAVAEYFYKTIKDYATGENDANYDVISSDIEFVMGLEGFGMEAALEDDKKDLDDLKASKDAFKTAQALYAENKYIEAIPEYKKVIEDDKENYDAAVAKITEATDSFRTGIMNQAKTEADGGNYPNAIEILEKGLEVLTDDSQLKEAVSTYTSTYEQSNINSAQSHIDKDEYPEAISILKKACQALPSSSVLNQKYQSAISAYESYAINGADSLVADGLYDDALTLLSKAMDTLPDNANIQSKYNEVKDSKPNRLQDVKVVSSDKMTTQNESVSDRYGNSYTDGISFDASRGAYALYNLNKKYSSFETTIFVSEKASNGKDISIIIYLDGEVAHTEINITEESGPIHLTLDVEEVSTMKIETANDGTPAYGFLILGDPRFKD